MSQSDSVAPVGKLDIRTSLKPLHFGDVYLDRRRFKCTFTGHVSDLVGENHTEDVCVAAVVCILRILKALPVEDVLMQALIPIMPSSTPGTTIFAFALTCI
jgi:hypothetical protein